jgi:hypothetical protein
LYRGTASGSALRAKMRERRKLRFADPFGVPVSTGL